MIKCIRLKSLIAIWHLSLYFLVLISLSLSLVIIDFSLILLSFGCSICNSCCCFSLGSECIRLKSWLPSGASHDSFNVLISLSFLYLSFFIYSCSLICNSSFSFWFQDCPPQWVTVTQAFTAPVAMTFPTPRQLRVPLASTAPWGVVSRCPATPATSPTSHRQPYVWSALLASTACPRKWLLVRTLCHWEGSGSCGWEQEGNCDHWWESFVIWREVVVRTRGKLWSLVRTLCHLEGNDGHGSDLPPVTTAVAKPV